MYQLQSKNTTMRKLKSQMQMTINEYVAGPNGETDWMTWNPDNDLVGFLISHIDASDTLLRGKKAADGFISH